MKKQIFLGLALLSGVSFTSCEEDVLKSDNQSRDYVPMTTINAIIKGEKEVQLKNAFIEQTDGEGKIFYKNQWSENDSFYIFNIQQSNINPLISIFSNEGQINLNTFVFKSGIAPEINSECDAIYPVSIANTEDYTLQIKDTLHYEAGKIIPNESWGMIALTNNDTFRFEPISALLRIKVRKDLNKGSKITSIKLSASNTLSGKMTWDNNGNIIGYDGYSNNYLVMDYGEGVELEQDVTTFYIPVIAKNYTDLNITIQYEDGKVFQDLERADVTFEPGKYYTTNFKSCVPDEDMLLMVRFYYPENPDTMASCFDNLSSSHQYTSYINDYNFFSTTKDAEGNYYIELKELIDDSPTFSSSIPSLCSVNAIEFYFISESQYYSEEFSKTDWLRILNSTVVKANGDINWLQCSEGKISINPELSSIGNILKIYPASKTCEITN